MSKCVWFKKGKTYHTSCGFTTIVRGRGWFFCPYCGNEIGSSGQQEYQRRYQEKNKVKVKAYHDKYNEEHKEERAEYYKKRNKV